VILLVALLLQVAEPHLGYCYPAGGRQGTTVRAFVGGQLLQGAKDVFVTGPGVSGKVVRYLGRVIRLNGEERREILRRLKKEAPDPKVKLPRHPLIDDLDKLSDLEIEYFVNKCLRFDAKDQPNPQLAEAVFIELDIAADAPAGDREIRIRGALGLSNPVVFQVGALAEALEPKPYDIDGVPGATLDLPVTLNGFIKPGDVDRFKVRASKGRPLVFQVHARRLIPFIADAVPGWFQAVLALRDGQGREVAFADDFRFDPDPVLFVKIPATGEYEVEIHDSIFRGREDFVYRVTISEQPFVKSLFPLGGRAGEPLVAAVDGWNLKDRKLALDTGPGEPIRASGRLAYAVGDLPEFLEAETNDDLKSAQKVQWPAILNGRIAKAGDEDWFQFTASGQLVVEIQARRLLSPMDSLVQLRDATGKTIAWNDDFERKDGDLRPDMGSITHHADSYLRTTLPAEGVYYVRVVDAQNQGGEGHAYRLRLSAPRPDFTLRMTPSTLNLRPGLASPITVHVLRRDGFQEPIELSLKDAPAGFKLQGATVPAGCERLRLTMTAAPETLAQPVTLRIVGASGELVREAIPCEDSMQAFLWRHLVPSQGLFAWVGGARARLPLPEIAGPLPVRIVRGATTEVRFKTGGRLPENLGLELSDPPPGVSIAGRASGADGLVLTIKAENDGADLGTGGNLIVALFLNQAGGRGRNRRLGMGVLPAIPFVIVSTRID
jgi:hypothetical protein